VQYRIITVDLLYGQRSRARPPGQLITPATIILRGKHVIDVDRLKTAPHSTAPRRTAPRRAAPAWLVPVISASLYRQHEQHLFGFITAQSDADLVRLKQ